MNRLNKNDNHFLAAAAAAAATILTVAIIMATSSMATPTAATLTTTEEATTTTTTPPEGIELSPESVYQERQITVGETAINQTHVQLASSGNGTLTLPNTTETINTTSTGSLIVSLDGTGAGKEVITTEDGTESVTATIYAIARFGMEGGRGITIALLDTDSAGRLAPLDGMILAGQIEIPPPPEEAALITLWEWHSGIPLPPTAAATTTMENPPITNMTTTTNATTAASDDTNAATAPPEGVGGAAEGGQTTEEEAVGGAEVAE